MKIETLLLNYFETLRSSLGPSNWWPGETPFEIAVGAILTQNTNWSNVEKAILNLKSQNLLDPETMFFLGEDELAQLIRSAGYFRVKARRLKNFLFFLNNECAFNFSYLQNMDIEELRAKLLEVKGIGPETADSILLYALNKPTFVVDAYTARIFNRHSLVHQDVDYHQLREMFMSNLPEDPELYNEFHALVVRTAKKWCKKKNPLCHECPLSPYLDQ
ncbi:endonuclease III domain-containing protein [Desulfonatronovibrio hydrogenovorans]|uniref:endonuclease III domain-containing protein n=1 Tax=Desulfonatronovibrio hydrogenovorans TaxID=53245 RepID=UPI00048FA390|nr:endonuclease [Desulfonatronovibrio hydrogenovorans]